MNAAAFQPITSLAKFEALTLREQKQFALDHGITEVECTKGDDAGQKFPVRDLMVNASSPKKHKFNIRNSNFIAQVRAVIEAAPPAAAAPAPAPAPAPTTGTGLRKVYFKNTKIIRGRGFNNSVDDSVGIQKPKAYVPFGRHYIHVGKLGQGLLQIKRSGGNTIPDLPTQRISNELQKVMEDLISGMNPSFGSVYNLSDDEKDLFNRIVRTTSIDQRLQIPAPELTNDQQMYHRYQVLAGEIASGQDNPAVIKELKGLLIKLSNKRILPKAKVHDVLCDLLALGF